MISLVTGVSGAGISTWAACEAVSGGRELLVSAPVPPPGVRSRRIGDPATPPSGDFGQALAALSGVPAAGLDDAMTAAFADVVTLWELPGSDRSAVADLGAWPCVASAVSDVERFAAHCARVVPRVDGVGGDASVFLRIMELARRLGELSRWLADPASVRITYVATPDPHGLESAVRAMSAAHLLGVCVEGIVVNRCLSELDPDSMWGRRRSAQQAASLERFSDLARDVGCGMSTVVEMACSPTTVESLHELGRSSRVVAQRDPRSTVEPASGPLRVPSGCSACPVDGGYELSIPVGSGAGGVEASRRGDMLLVRTGGVQRQLLLSGALARCDIAQGRRTGDWLVLTMIPDPRLWPKAESA